MDAPQTPTTPMTTPPPSGEPDVQAEFQALRQQVIWVLLIVIVISGTLNIFFLRVWNFTRASLHNSRALYVQELSQFESQTNRMTQIVNGLTDYGHSHPDFMGILNHYGLSNSPAATPGKP